MLADKSIVFITANQQRHFWALSAWNFEVHQNILQFALTANTQRTSESAASALLLPDSLKAVQRAGRADALPNV